MALLHVSHPPWLRLVGVGHPTHIFLIFPGHPESWTPLQIPSWGPPLGCNLLHREPGAPHDGTFGRPSVWWLIQTGCVGAYALAFLWKPQGGQMRRTRSPICSYSFTHLSHHISPATNILGAPPTPGPTSLISSLLKKNRNKALYLMHTLLLPSAIFSFFPLAAHSDNYFSLFLCPSLLTAFSSCLLIKNLH